MLLPLWCSCYWTVLGSPCLKHSKASLVTGLWWRKVYCLWHGSKEREWCSKSLPQWLPGKGFSRQCEGASHRVCNQLVGSSLIGWWWVNRVMFQESLWSVFWSGVYIMMASMQWGAQCLWDSLRTWLRILSISLGEEPKVLDFVFNGSTIMVFVWLDYFPLFLHFLTSLIKFALQNSGNAKEARYFLPTRGWGT